MAGEGFAAVAALSHTVAASCPWLRAFRPGRLAPLTRITGSHHLSFAWFTVCSFSARRLWFRLRLDIVSLAAQISWEAQVAVVDAARFCEVSGFLHTSSPAASGRITMAFVSSTFPAALGVWLLCGFASAFAAIRRCGHVFYFFPHTFTFS